MKIHNIGIIGHGVIGQMVSSLCTTEGYHNVHIVDPKLGYNHSLSSCDVIFMCTNVQSQDSFEDYATILNDYRKQAPASCIFVLVSTMNYNWLDRLAVDVVMPEFVREKHVNADFHRQKEIILGGEPKYCEFVANLVDPLKLKKRVITSKQLAMQCKLFVNAFLSVKVNFANMAHSEGGDDLIALLKLDKRLGETHLEVPGPDKEKGFGGTCLPKDLRILRNVLTGVGKSCEQAYFGNILVMNEQHRNGPQ